MSVCCVCVCLRPCVQPPADSSVLAVMWTVEGADRLVLFHGPAGGCRGRPGHKRFSLAPLLSPSWPGPVG